MCRIAPTRWTVGIFVAALVIASIISTHHSAASVTGESWSAPPRAARAKNPERFCQASINAGKVIYADQCLFCHGPGGRGDGPSSSSDLNPRPADLSDSRLFAESDGTLFWKLTSGRAPMPGFNDLLSPEDRWNVVNYLRSLAPRPTTVATTQE